MDQNAAMELISKADVVLALVIFRQDKKKILFQLILLELRIIEELIIGQKTQAKLAN